MAARRAGEGYGGETPVDVDAVANDETLREHATVAREFDPAEIQHGHRSKAHPPVLSAALPLVVVIAVNLLMTFLCCRGWTSRSWPKRAGAAPRCPQWPACGRWWWRWAPAIATVILANWTRLPALRQTMDAGANASVLPALSVASLVGFGAVVASLPAFDTVQDWVLGIEGGPLVSLAVATNILAALTGSASGGLTIALDALGQNYMDIAAQGGIDPGLMHRVAVIGSGTLDILPHNGAVVSLLAICGLTHRESYLDIAVVGIASSLLALAAVIVLGTAFGSF